MTQKSAITYFHCGPRITFKLFMPHIELGDAVVPVSTVAKNIIFIVNALSTNQCSTFVRVAYFHVHCIGTIRNLLDRKTTEIMIHTYVILALTMETGCYTAFPTTFLAAICTLWSQVDSKEYKLLLPGS